VAAHRSDGVVRSAVAIDSRLGAEIDPARRAGRRSRQPALFILDDQEEEMPKPNPKPFDLLTRVSRDRGIVHRRKLLAAVREEHGLSNREAAFLLADCIRRGWLHVDSRGQVRVHNHEVHS
jgi:hypothetical protein